MKRRELFLRRLGLGGLAGVVCLLCGCSVLSTTAAVTASAVSVAGTVVTTAVTVGSAAAGAAIETGKVAAKATGAVIDAATSD